MTENAFVNEAITKGINNYINKINDNDFETIVINSLVLIYGELDILNPFKTNNEFDDYGFDDNLVKYGFENEKLSLFKQYILDVYEKDDENKKNEIKKIIIDMFYCKKNNTNTSIEDEKKLYKLLKIQDGDVKRYFEYKNYSNLKDVSFIKEDNNLLVKESYEMLGYSYEDILDKNEMELNVINNEIYKYFYIDPSDENKKIRVAQAVEYYKEFGVKEIKKDNNDAGKVELLLILGFIFVSIVSILVVVGILIK